MKEVCLGVIGYGNMGSGNSNHWYTGKVPGGRLAAVCDIDPDQIAKAKTKFGEDVKYYDDPGAMIASGDVNAVYIATPHYDHPPLAIQALEAGLHVLVEKPAGGYTKQAREMMAVADAHDDLVFGLMFNQRTRSAHQKMRDLVQSGELGELYRTNWIITNWFRSQSYYDSGGWRASWRGEGGGVLLNQCPHNLDLWQWIAGMPKRVRAFCSFGRYHDIEVEDDVTAYVEYPNGATGLFVTTTGEAPGTNRLEVVGDRGKIIMEGGTVKFWRTRESVKDFCRTTEKRFNTPETWECAIPARDSGAMEHLGIFQNWTRAILHGDKLLAPGQEGIHSLTLSNAMLLSAWTDQWVDLPMDDDKFYDLLKEKIDTSRYVKKAVKKTESEDLSGTFN